MVKPANKMIRIDQEASLELFDRTRQVSRERLFRSFSEVVIGGLSLSKRCSRDRHDSQAYSNRVETILSLKSLLVRVVLSLIGLFTGSIL